ncbi:MAG TPA: hypothetical protein VKP88_07100 [Candidatus Paceibacterota bacterium]|nr:hypothetical protein [Candidatus Paceibacterota bacterium]
MPEEQQPTEQVVKLLREVLDTQRIEAGRITKVEEQITSLANNVDRYIESNERYKADTRQENAIWRTAIEEKTEKRDFPIFQFWSGVALLLAMVGGIGMLVIEPVDERTNRNNARVEILSQRFSDQAVASARNEADLESLMRMEARYREDIISLEEKLDEYSILKERVASAEAGVKATNAELAAMDVHGTRKLNQMLLDYSIQDRGAN